MQLLFVVLAAFYLVMAPILFVSWVGFFRRGEQLSPRERWISHAVIALATLLWPLVVPIAYLELMDKFKRVTKATGLVDRSSLYSSRLSPLSVADRDASESL